MADLTGPVDVFAWALHGHLIMTRGRLEHYRAGEFLGVLGCMGYNGRFGTQDDGVDGCTAQDYRFDFQQTIDITDALRRVTIQPNDELRMVCEFNSIGRDAVTRAGFGSEDEMCQMYIYTSPGEHVTTNFAFTSQAVMTVDDDRGDAWEAEWWSPSG